MMIKYSRNIIIYFLTITLRLNFKGIIEKTLLLVDKMDVNIRFLAHFSYKDKQGWLSKMVRGKQRFRIRAIIDWIRYSNKTWIRFRLREIRIRPETIPGSVSYLIGCTVVT